MANQEIAGQGQYLTFMLSDEQYALDIPKIREVIKFEQATKIPQTPKFMLGVINLRGSVVPVIDMRVKFGMKAAEKTVDTSVIIIEVNIEEEIVTIGALVDSVNEVIDISESQIEPPPKVGTKLNTEFIKGMGKLDEEFVIILNVEKIFTLDELQIVTGVNEDLNAESSEDDSE